MTNSVLLRITLPNEIVDEYEKQAESRQCTLEEILALKLEETVEIKDARPIIFEDKARRELDSLLGVNCSSAEQIVDRIRRSFSIRLSDGKSRHPIELKPALIERLRSRCFNMDFGEFLNKLVIEKLSEYAEGR